MQFFVDSANIEEIRSLQDLGIIDGVTTNPSLVRTELEKKSSLTFPKLIEKICGIVSGPVSAEVIAVDCEKMVQEGKELASIAENVVVKVPLTIEGIKACRLLSDENIMVNVTLCFSAAQGLLAAKAGAYYVSPFMGRLDDIGWSGVSLIKELVDIFMNYPDIETEVLAASVRHPMHVIEAAKIGADIVTMPPKLFWQLFQHPLTESGLAAFLKDWTSNSPAFG